MTLIHINYSIELIVSHVSALFINHVKYKTFMDELLNNRNEVTTQTDDFLCARVAYKIIPLVFGDQ